MHLTVKNLKTAILVSHGKFVFTLFGHERSFMQLRHIDNVVLMSSSAVANTAVQLINCVVSPIYWQAKNRAAQRLVYIPRFEDHTGMLFYYVYPWMAVLFKENIFTSAFSKVLPAKHEATWSLTP